MAKLTIPAEELMQPGHAACPGCGPALAMRLLLKGLGPRTILSIPACCWTVIATPYPTTALGVAGAGQPDRGHRGVDIGAPGRGRCARLHGPADRRVRRGRRHRRHRPAGAERDARAPDGRDLRDVRQRGVHEHGDPAQRGDAAGRLDHDDAGLRRCPGEVGAEEGHHGDRPRAFTRLRRHAEPELPGGLRAEGRAVPRDPRPPVLPHPGRVSARAGGTHRRRRSRSDASPPTPGSSRCTRSRTDGSGSPAGSARSSRSRST